MGEKVRNWLVVCVQSNREKKTYERLTYTKGFYPGAERVDAMTLAYETGDWYEANRFLLFAI